jgi:hypothetical protein
MALALAASLGARPAAAGEAAKKAAKPHYDKGAAEYNLGHFADAIIEFEKAYELDPAPILLFNIAQAHRQNGDNERAAFFYRRYLEQAPDAENRADVEKRIKDLESVMQQQADVKRRPPTEVSNGDQKTQPGHQPTTPPPVTVAPVASVATPTAVSGNTAVVVETTPTTTQAAPPTVTAGPVVEAPARIRMWVAAGPAFPSFSGRDLHEPALFSMRLGASYSFDLGTAGVVDVGGSLSYAPMTYTTTTSPSTNQGAGFFGVLATGTYRYKLVSTLEVLGELGVGAVWWSGLGDNNPFTVDGSGASGPVPMPTLLLGAGLIYHLPGRWVVFGEPAFLISKTTSDGLSSAVSSVSRFDLAVGIGYSM